MRTTILRTGTTLLLLVGLGACGGGSGGSSPQGPSTAATPAPRAWTSGTTVSVVSGEDYAPVEGAQVTVGTRQYTSDGSGQFVLAEDAPYGTLVDIVASAFLSRQTSIPSHGAARFVLWPRETSSGMSEAFTAQIVYTYGWSEEPAHGTSGLVRIPEGTTQVFVWASEDILGDDRAGETHEQAVDKMNAALDGRAVYVLTATRPSNGVVFEARIGDGGDECGTTFRGFFRPRYTPRGEIAGGEIVYCGVDVARSSTVIHELGHSIGLQHTYRSNELMGATRLSYWYYDEHVSFTEREALAMRLLFERPAGNRFPDTDRGVTGAATGGSHRILCY